MTCEAARALDWANVLSPGEHAEPFLGKPAPRDTLRRTGYVQGMARHEENPRTVEGSCKRGAYGIRTALQVARFSARGLHRGLHAATFFVPGRHEFRDPSCG